MGQFVEVEIGTKLNKLTSISQSFKKTEDSGREYWITCECECGIIKDIRKRDFLQARVRSCGCGQLSAAKEFGLASRKYSGIDSAKRLAYGIVKTKAKSRDKAFSLTYDEFLQITEKDCYYCGSKPSNITKSQNSQPGQYVHNGIDRVDNKIGYEVNNVVACCTMCNIMKSNHDENNFLNHCKKIAENN